MKTILVFLFAASSMMAMQHPKSKQDCFLAYTKFKSFTAMAVRTEQYRMDYRESLHQRYYETFVKECREEMDQNKNTCSK